MQTADQPIQETSVLDTAAVGSFAKCVTKRLRELTGVPAGIVPLHEPEFRGTEWALVKECLDTGWVSSVGSFVDRFETEIATVSDAAHAVAVVNGTAALHLALQVAGVKPGDEVIAPSLTFVATANAIAYTGATPHFVDIEPSSLGVDAVALRTHLERIADRHKGTTVNRKTGRRIGALIVMHTFGHPADMEPLQAIADRYELPLVEDAAESLGSEYKGRLLGAIGRLGAISFNGNKIATTGGGGALVTNDSDLAQRAKHLATTAKKPHRWAFIHDEVGYNYRMPNLNAALGCAQLAQLDGFVARKRTLARRYCHGFADIMGLKYFLEPPYAKSNYWLNSLLLDRSHAAARNPLLDRLNKDGLMARPVWTPMHRLPIYANAQRAALPVTEDIEARLINIPSSAKLGEFALERA